MKQIAAAARRYSRPALQYLVVLAIGFHLASILLHAGMNAYHSYTGFYDLKPNESLKWFQQKVVNGPVLTAYGRISGTECGFGFFAPNVRSSGALTLGGCGQKLMPEFKTHEGRLRYEGFIGDMINDISRENKQHADTTLFAMKDNYNKLLLKNIATTTIKQQPKPCALYKMDYCLIDFPDLSEVREHGPRAPKLVPMRTFMIFPDK
jgi:hypothetical protein